MLRRTNANHRRLRGNKHPGWLFGQVHSRAAISSLGSTHGRHCRCTWLAVLRLSKLFSPLALAAPDSPRTHHYPVSIADAAASPRALDILSSTSICVPAQGARSRPARPLALQDATSERFLGDQGRRWAASAIVCTVFPAQVFSSVARQWAARAACHIPLPLNNEGQ